MAWHGDPVRCAGQVSDAAQFRLRHPARFGAIRTIRYSASTIRTF